MQNVEPTCGVRPDLPLRAVYGGRPRSNVCEHGERSQKPCIARFQYGVFDRRRSRATDVDGRNTPSTTVDRQG